MDMLHGSLVGRTGRKLLSDDGWGPPAPTANAHMDGRWHTNTISSNEDHTMIVHCGLGVVEVLKKVHV